MNRNLLADAMVSSLCMALGVHAFAGRIYSDLGSAMLFGCKNALAQLAM